MYYCTIKIQFLVLFFVNLISIRFVEADTIVAESILDELYLKYKEAVSDDTSNTSLRRFYKDNKEYEVHVKKLKEVNGFKKHNLIVKENLRKGSPLIYINNPVESKIPNAFLSIEEFKTVLTKRGLNQRATVSNTNTTITTKKYVLPKISSTITLKSLIDNTNHFLNNDLSTKKAPITKVKIDNIELTTKGNILPNTTVPENINLTQNSFQSSVLVASKKQTSVTTIAPSKLSLRSKMLPNLVGSTENEKNVIRNEKSTKLLEISQGQQNLVEINNTTSLVNIISTQNSSIQTSNVSKREGPRRKKTTKFTFKSTLESTKTRRTTLGRPLVFMGS